jgi:hypothetical protein
LSLAPRVFADWMTLLVLPVAAHLARPLMPAELAAE